MKLREQLLEMAEDMEDTAEQCEDAMSLYNALYRFSEQLRVISETLSEEDI